jgi:hypothetical protein
LGSTELVRIAGKAHVQAYGDVWVVDQRQGPAPLDAWHVAETEPNPIEWLLFGGWEPVRRIGNDLDPLRTWEWRVHLGQPTTPPPAIREPPAASLDDLRILHNAAVAAGAIDRAALLRGEIESRLDRSVAADFQHGVRLVGVRSTHGARAALETWWAAAGPLGGDDVFRVRSTVDARAVLSTIPPDPIDREMLTTLELPTRLWRPGFLYVIDMALLHRIGRERYLGSWFGPDAPRRLDGRNETLLADLR